MLRAVPAIILIALSSSRAFKSLFFICTISANCLRVTLPTISRFGVPEPFAIEAAYFNNTAAGGDLRIKLKDRSA